MGVAIQGGFLPRGIIESFMKSLEGKLDFYRWRKVVRIVNIPVGGLDEQTHGTLVGRSWPWVSGPTGCVEKGQEKRQER